MSIQLIEASQEPESPSNNGARVIRHLKESQESGTKLRTAKPYVQRTGAKLLARRTLVSCTFGFDEDLEEDRSEPDRTF
jgi:hypothetical protein